MFQYNPAETNRADKYLYEGPILSAKTLADAQMNASQIDAQANVGLVNDIGSSLLTLASAYGKKRDKKDMLAGMDQSVNAMSDIGAVTSDFRERYMNAPENVRPFLFEAVASPMLKSFSAGQSAAAQAQAWDKYNRNQGTGGGGGGQPNPFTY